MFKEKAITYGENRILTGVATVPDRLTENVALVYFNAGLLHRVGPHRTYVSLARKLAKEGFLSLRFDLSGLGDSILRTGTKTEDQRVIKDITESLDYLENRFEIKKFVLVGLCSGADHSLLVAEMDSRVVGCSLIDGVGYRTFRYYINYLKKRLTNIKIVKAFISRKFFGGRAVTPEIFIREFPPRSDMLSLINKILCKGTQLQLIYTGGIEDYYNYKGQFFDCFPELKGKSGLDIKEVAGSDHTLTHITERIEVENHICAFIRDLSRSSVST